MCKYTHLRVYVKYILLHITQNGRVRSSVWSEACDTTRSRVWHDAFWSPEVYIATHSESTVYYHCCSVLQCVTWRGHESRGPYRNSFCLSRVSQCDAEYCSVKDDTLNPEVYIATGWRRLIESPKLQIIFHKRATKCKALLRKMTYSDKGSYKSSPPCTHSESTVCFSVL